MPFNLTSGNETKIVTYILADSVHWFHCMAEAQSIGSGLKPTYVRQYVLLRCKEDYERKKSLSSVPDFVCFACDAESE
jgi:hypothetical protein